MFRSFRIGALAAALGILLFQGQLPTAMAEQTMKLTEKTSSAAQNYRNTYAQYLTQYADVADAEETLYLTAEHVTTVTEESQRRDSYEGKDGVIVIPQDASATWSFTISQSGLYHVGITYMALPGKMMDIEFALRVDGELPFFEAETLTLQRLWKDDGAIRRDNNDNDLKPGQVEQTVWQTKSLWDNDGLTDTDIALYLEKGEHTLSLSLSRESMAVAELTLGGREKLPTYVELQVEYERAGYQPAGSYYFERQEEESYEKSQPNLAPVAQYATASVIPCSPSKIRLNTLGGENWKYPGETVTWQVDVDTPGLYQLNFKYIQDYIRGFKVHRRISINGKVPCQEMETVEFDYTNVWKNKTLTTDNGEPMLFYLEAGENFITLDVSLGMVTTTLQVVEDSVYRLNDIYRKIIKITGLSPDFYRDYYLENDIPDLLETFQEIADALEEEASHVEEMNGVKGGEASLFYQIAKQLRNFIKNPQKISAQLDAYKSNVSSLAELILRLKEQPLLLDSLSISSENYPLPKASAGFFAEFSFRFQAFFASFFEDYNALGNVYRGEEYTIEPVTVWVSANDMATTGTASGQDQMQILKQLIDDLYVPESGIPINLSLVDSSSTLTQAILGGKGPDVALIVPKGTPVNLAMRGALQDLSQFEGFDEVRSWFYESAFVPYYYEDGIYGMPETQAFNMMFYRTDVFNELGIEPPNTWEEFYRIVPKIQKENMQIGMQENQALFETLVLQRGGSYYKDDWSSTNFDQPEAISAFKEWTEFYTKYDFPLYFDAYNRFRTGEIPLIIQSYTFYNYLTVAAPEIRNLWAMAPIPGTVGADGTINRAQSAQGTCAIMLRDAKNPKAAFDFIRWWVGEEAQAEFGTALETILGPAARYNTANVRAFERLPWSGSEQRVLGEAWKQVWDIPNVPGNYYITRSITNAFRQVVYNNENPRETLLRYNKDMNNEIQRKREEFGLD